MAQMVASALVQEAVSGAISFVFSSGDEKASHGHLMQRLEMAHCELEFALERSSKMPVNDVALIRRRLLIKRDFDECNEVVCKNKQPVVEDDKVDHRVSRLSSLRRKIMHAVMPSFITPNKDLLSSTDVTRFESSADRAGKFIRDVESCYTLAHYRFFTALIRQLLEGKTLIYQMQYRSQCLRLLVETSRVEGHGIVATLKFEHKDHQLPMKKIRLLVMLRLSQSTDILGITIKCLMSAGAQFKSLVEVAGGELSRLPTQDVTEMYSYTMHPSLYYNIKSGVYRPDPLCCVANGINRPCDSNIPPSEMAGRFPEEIITLWFGCHASASGSASDEAQINTTKTWPPVELTATFLPHRRLEEKQGISLQQTEETFLAKAIDCFIRQPEMTKFTMSWDSAHGSAYFVVEKPVKGTGTIIDESNTQRAAAVAAKPPVARKVQYKLVEHEDLRVDDYYWLRDISCSHPAVLAHLEAENAYTAAIMSDAKNLEEEIFDENINKGFLEYDVGLPLRKGQYYYYERKLSGKEYVQHCRRRVTTVGPITVHDVMPTGPDAPIDHIILDENVQATDHDYYSMKAFKVSPSGKLVAYAEDTKGGEFYTLYVIDAESGEHIGQPLSGITSFIEWAGDDHLVYITLDNILRPDKVWLHNLQSDQSDDICLYHQKDNTCSLGLRASESKQYLFVEYGSKNTSFTYYMDISKESKELAILRPSVYDIDITASHRGNHFYIKRRSEQFYNSELVACPLDNTVETTVLLRHRERVTIQSFQLFENHIVVYERENGLPRLTVYRLPANGEPVGQLQGGQSIEFTNPYEIDFVESESHSSILRYRYSSINTPPGINAYDMDSHVTVLKKIYAVSGGFEPSYYVTTRKWVALSNCTHISMSILYKKDLVKLDGSDPMLLYGYGSYEISIDPGFNGSIYSLVDRGFIYVIAHIRGGGEMGRKWYEDGRLLKKKNTFTDFIACAEYLIENKYCSKDTLCISGESAGGLLMGAVLNMRPDLFKVVVARAPFVDVLTTMLDKTIPFTTTELKEWGDPKEKEYYDYMKSYSPVDNIKAQDYPHILVTAGINDTRVMYYGPAKFVAKLRELKTDGNLLLFNCELGTSHFSKSGRCQKLREDAFTYAFILKALGMNS